MNHWFNAEILIRQQQMEMEKESKESWKFRHRPRITLREEDTPQKKRRIQAGNKRCVGSN